MSAEYPSILVAPFRIAFFAGAHRTLVDFGKIPVCRTDRGTESCVFSSSRPVNYMEDEPSRDLGISGKTVLNMTIHLHTTIFADQPAVLTGVSAGDASVKNVRFVRFSNAFKGYYPQNQPEKTAKK
jgi:hypothetical protein